MKRLFTLTIAFSTLWTWSFGQNVGVDVAAPEQKLDVAGGIKIGNTSNGVAGSIRWNGTDLQIHDGTSWVSLGANTDDQQFDVIQLSGTDLQLSLENDGVGTISVDLSSLADNTDDQTIDLAQLTGTSLELSLEDDGQAPQSIDLSSLANTDDQTIDLMTINADQLTLSLEDDGQAPLTVDLSGYLDNTDNQQFDVVQLTGTNLELSLQADGQATHVIDLSSLADNTDDQTIDVAQLVGTDLQLSLEDDGQATLNVDMSGLANTDDQTIDTYNITGDQLTISLEDDGQAPLTVDLTPYKDNTDDQQLDLLQLNGNNLEVSLEDDGQAPQTVDLSVFADNTDDQTFDIIQLVGDNLELSLENDGQATHSIDLSGYSDNTDDQTIDVFSLIGTDLNLSLEDDATATQIVDLSPLKTSLEDTDADTKVEVEANPDEDRIRFTSASAERMIIREDGKVGIGTSTPDNQLTVGGSPSATYPALGLNSGNTQADFNNGAQIAFGYNNTDEYQHFIHTRHNQLAATNNAIDFYVHSGGNQNNSVTSGSTHVMSMNAGNVGIGTTSPLNKLQVIGSGTIGGSNLANAWALVGTATSGIGMDPNELYFRGGNGNFGVIGNNSLSVNVNGSLRMRIAPNGEIRVPYLDQNATRVVMADADGDLYAGDLDGTGLGDNLGDHVADQNLNMNGYDIDFIRGNSGQIRSLGTLSLDWTSGSYDDSRYHGIESKNEAGNLNDDIRINSYDGIVNTLDANNNNGTSWFKIQHHTIGNGTDLFAVRSSTGTVQGDLYLNGKLAFRSSDSWLRLNQDGNFSSGTYTPNMFRSDGGYQVDGQWVIDNNAGWHRMYGNTGWYNGTHGGGMYMTNSTYVRTYNAKPLQSNGLLFQDERDMRTAGDGSIFRYAGNASLAFDDWLNFYDSNNGTQRISMNIDDGSVRAYRFYDYQNSYWYTDPGNGNRMNGQSEIARNTGHTYIANGQSWGYCNTCQSSAFGCCNSDWWGCVSYCTGTDCGVCGQTVYHRMSINGGVTSYAFWTSSDKKYKSDVATIPNALSYINQVRGVSYKLINPEEEQSNYDPNNDVDQDYIGPQIGFIAQELQAVLPQLVKETEDKKEDGTTEKTLGVAYGQMTALLVEGIKEQQKMIEELQREVASLKAGGINSDDVKVGDQQEILDVIEMIESNMDTFEEKHKAEIQEFVESIRNVKYLTTEHRIAISKIKRRLNK